MGLKNPQSVMLGAVPPPIFPPRCWSQAVVPQSPARSVWGFDSVWDVRRVNSSEQQAARPIRGRTHKILAKRYQAEHSDGTACLRRKLRG